MKFTGYVPEIKFGYATGVRHAVGGQAVQQTQGQDNVQALMSNGSMAQKPHRQQSGHVVANALLQAVAGIAKQR